MRSSRRAALRFASRLVRLGCIIAAASYAGALLLSGCTSPPPVVLALFDTTPPKHRVHSPRRPPYETPKPPPPVDVQEEAPQIDWAALLDQLPKEAAGGTDWVRALNEGLIKPKPGLDASAEDQPALDLDVELVPRDAPDFKATYPHKPHTQILACANCHPAIFQMEKGADPITMEKIFAGEYCGRCHGKVAFDVATGCPRCHLAMPR